MGRILGIALIGVVFLGVLVGSHAYLVQRLVVDTGVAQPWRGLATAAIAILGASLVLQPASERLLDPVRTRGLAWVASLWMGFAFVLLTLTAVSDLVLWGLGNPALAAPLHPGAGGRAAGWRVAAVLGATLAIGGVALRTGLRPPALVRVSFEIARWPAALDGFRIVQISDIHIGPIRDRRFAEHLVERVNALEPDLVAVTGDLVDGNARHLAVEVAPFAGLRGRHGVFFVTGNHDHLSDARSWVDVVRRLDMRVLRNERVRIGDGSASFDLAGVDDHHGHWIGGGREDLDAALRDRDGSIPVVLLAHDPTTFRAARSMGIDLQISGHTHGGQIWPFHYLVRLVIPWVAGRHRDGSAQLYVSRGSGFWGPPMRLLAPAEITEITLRTERVSSTEEVPLAL